MKRNYRRTWIRGYYHKIEIETYGGKKKKVRKWVKPHWRKIYIKKKSSKKTICERLAER